MTVVNGAGFDYGIAGQVLTSNGPGIFPTFQDSSSFNPAISAPLFDDFISQDPTRQPVFVLSQSTFSPAYLYPPTTFSNHPGIFSFSTVLTRASDYATIATTPQLIGTSPPSWFYPTLVIDGTGPVLLETDIYIPQLSIPTARYCFYFGLSLGSIQFSTATSYVVFRYQDNVNSGRFQATTKSGATTTQDTGIPVLASTWYKLGLSITNTSAVFSINGSVVNTITTNIPTGTPHTASVTANGVSGSFGVNTRFLNIDYLYVEKRLTTPR